MMQPRRRRILRILLLVFAVGGLWFGYRIYYFLTTVVPDAYCVWNVADLVIRYMEDHQGKWPQGWDDLRQTYNTGPRRAWSFTELNERVAIDFDADPQALSQATPTDGKPPFRIIWTNNGSDAYWSKREPNRLVFEYLKEHPPNFDQSGSNESPVRERE